MNMLYEWTWIYINYSIINKINKCNLLTNLKVESKLINRNCVFSRVVLHDTCEKGLSEEEPRNPEHAWFIVLKPILHVTAQKLPIYFMGIEMLKRVGSINLLNMFQSGTPEISKDFQLKTRAL